MRIVAVVLFSLFLFASCNNNKPKTLKDALIRSLQENNFELLESYLPDREFFYSLGRKVMQRSTSQVDLSLVESRQKIKTEWQEVLKNATDRKINLEKVILKEALLFDPFPFDDVTEAMVITYEYNGKQWDDLQLIIGRVKNKICLLGIPNPTMAFSMSDPGLHTALEAGTWIDTQKPEFIKELHDLTDKIFKAVKDNNLDEFGKHLVYRGPDEKKKWKIPLNMSDSSERQQASEFLQQVNQLIMICNKAEQKEIRTERESEGVWIIMPMQCDEKTISFAYLRINGRLLLGDADTEKQ